MFKSTFFLAFALAGALFIGGCNENTTDVITGTKPNAPTAIMAQSASATSVKIKWTAPSGTFDSYHVKIMDGTTLVKEDKAVAKTATTYTATGLTEGKAYSFEVMAVSGTEMSTAVKITWAPASRASGTFKLYSEKSTTFGSGIEITGTPVVLKIADGERWDLCFDDKGTDVRIAAPGQSRYVDNNYKFPNGNESKITRIGRVYTGVSSIDDIYDSKALNDVSNPADSLKEQFLELKNYDATKGGVGFVLFKDDSKNYAKVVILAKDGKLVQGSGNDTFVEIQVSYQTAANVPYAGIRPARTYPKKDQAHNPANAENLAK